MDTVMMPMPEHLVGTWRRFGSEGPIYRIIGEGESLPDGERTMRVVVVESGEELDYRLDRLLNDPREA